MSKEAWLPSPRHLEDVYRSDGFIPGEFVGRWVPVTEALPPERMPVLAMIHEGDCPDFDWMKYASGERDCPFFVCPGMAALVERGVAKEEPNCGFSITHWYATTDRGVYSDWNQGAWQPQGYKEVDITLGCRGWIKWTPTKVGER